MQSFRHNRPIFCEVLILGWASRNSVKCPSWDRGSRRPKLASFPVWSTPAISLRKRKTWPRFVEVVAVLQWPIPGKGGFVLSELIADQGWTRAGLQNWEIKIKKIITEVILSPSKRFSLGTNSIIPLRPSFVPKPQAFLSALRSVKSSDHQLTFRDCRNALPALQRPSYQIHRCVPNKIC